MNVSVNSTSAQSSERNWNSRSCREYPFCLCLWKFRKIARKERGVALKIFPSRKCDRMGTRALRDVSTWPSMNFFPSLTCTQQQSDIPTGGGRWLRGVSVCYHMGCGMAGSSHLLVTGGGDRVTSVTIVTYRYEQKSVQFMLLQASRRQTECKPLLIPNATLKWRLPLLFDVNQHRTYHSLESVKCIGTCFSIWYKCLLHNHQRPVFPLCQF